MLQWRSQDFVWGGGGADQLLHIKYVLAQIDN